MDMVTAWLRGNGVLPKTWGTLLHCLQETKMHQAVRSIQENILKCKLEVRIISPVACFSGLLCHWIFPTLKYVYAMQQLVFWYTGIPHLFGHSMAHIGLLISQEWWVSPSFV